MALYIIMITNKGLTHKKCFPYFINILSSIYHKMLAKDLHISCF